MRILFVGDPHYSSEQIPTRKDNYPETMLDKTQQSLELAKKLNVDLYLIGGDFCHIQKFSIGYFNKLMMLFRSYNFPKACVIGNHDIRYGRPESIERSLLGTMYISDTFLPRPGEWHIETRDSFVLFLPYMTDPLPPLHMYSEKKLVLATHYFYNRSEFKDSIPEEYTDKFDYIFLGHDHDAYPIQKVNKATIIRPGALSRGTRNKAALNRPIQVALVDTVADTCEYIPLMYRPVNEIFSMERMNRESVAKESRLVEGLSDSISVSDGTDVQKILDAMMVEEEVKINTKKWLIEGGIIV